MRSSNILQTAALTGAATLLLLMTAGSVAAATAAENGSGTTSGEKGASSSPVSFSAGVQGFLQRLAAPERKAAAVALASSYDPNFNSSSLLGSVAVLYDHGYLWDRVKSGNTAFKLEAVAGSMLRPDIRAVASVNMLALYYPPLPVKAGFRPYLEAGIGAIFTDYRVARQAYRHNFNPQAGIGTEIRAKDGSSMFVALRLHHVSNGGINRDNQGVNSLLLQLGRFF
jgi:hypothetical protein